MKKPRIIHKPTIEQFCYFVLVLLQGGGDTKFGGGNAQQTREFELDKNMTTNGRFLRTTYPQNLITFYCSCLSEHWIVETDVVFRVLHNAARKSLSLRLQWHNPRDIEKDLSID